MKRIIFFCLILNVISARGQTVVVNDKLIAQLTKNQAVRLTSNEGFLKSYEKQKQLYDDINKKSNQKAGSPKEFNKLWIVKTTFLCKKEKY